ncbi:MAG: glycosyltransferase [Vulcanimicrobiaceae bacterium]
MQARVSVVIPIYNNWWLTDRSLRALDRLRGTSATPFETIVVDNASTDETEREIARFPWVRYLRQERNLNFSGGCNAGARAAEAPIVLFLNNDAMPVGDAFTPLAAAFGDERVAIAGGLLRYEDGVTQAAGMVVLPNSFWWLSERNLPATLPTVAASRDAIGVTGAAMAVRRDWFLEAGGFDEGFINGFEDTDLCMRARESGYRVRYVADAQFSHYEGATPTRYDREHDNRSRFLHRWSEAIPQIPRTERGAIGAFSVARGAADPLCARALDDLLRGIRSFGHPVVEGSIAPWRLLDRRYREAARLDWFAPVTSAMPGVRAHANDAALATLETHGALEVTVPWMPAVSPDALAQCAVTASTDHESHAVAAYAGRGATAIQARAMIAAIDALASADPSVRVVVLCDRIDEHAHAIAQHFGTAASVRTLLERDGREPESVDFAVVTGLTDSCAYGNGLLSSAGIASVAVDGVEIRRVLDDDTAWLGTESELANLARRAHEHRDERLRLGRLAATDARHRFAPRRSAMRVIDLARAARFGLERPAQ